MFKVCECPLLASSEINIVITFDLFLSFAHAASMNTNIIPRYSHICILSLKIQISPKVLQYVLQLAYFVA